MSTDKTIPVKRTRPEHVVVEFDAERLKAPFLLRCGSFLIDYILLVCVPVFSLIIGRFYGADGVKLLNSELSNTGWLIMLLLALTNFVIFPMFNGQSIGKMLTGIRIVRKDGTPPSFWQLLVRHTIGYLLTALTLGLGFLFSALNARGRAFQDLVGGTVVIYGKQRVAREITE
ncbi:MAG: RDD family protein [Acidobacteria bacterium]|nr:RDD family protein [Acidobacteriota bacterium]